MQANSRMIITAAALLALASVGAHADKGGGGGVHEGHHDGGHNKAGSAVTSMTAPRSGITTAAPGMTTTIATPRASTSPMVTRGTGSTTSAIRSANGARHSGLPTGQGVVTADAAHQRNMARHDAKVNNRAPRRVENEVENEVELENEVENRPRMEREAMRRGR